MKKKAIVLGMGLSGRASAKFLHAKGYAVLGLDAKASTLMLEPEAKKLLELGIQIESDLDPAELSSFDELVLSPGIPSSHPLYLKAKEQGLKILGEAELAFRELKGQKAVAITGTNGKTTVTLLTEHILNSCGLKARSLGNIGAPLTEYFLDPDPEEIIVAELSSYQLETLQSAVFDAGVILNITPDHLDRYSSMEEYAQAKCQLQHCMGPSSSLYIYTDIVKEFGPLLTKQFLTFGEDPSSFLWTDGQRVGQAESIEYFLPVGYRQEGIHDSINAVAAWALCQPFGVSKEQFCRALETFSKPPHRIEFVKSIEDVSYYDDSKGTNIDAVIQAVRAMKGPVVLIAGGVDKGASYLPWKEPFLNKVKEIVVLGQAAEKIRRELHLFFKVTAVNSLSEAVEYAAIAATPGDIVLLSPGCSSYDMFRDYAHRGEEFQKCINKLEERRKKQ